MIQIFIKNEELDIDAETLVTFKKSQQLNGIQDLYSYSNNFPIKDSAKNRRLLGINYLPNSKAKSMTAGYDADVVFNRCIFLKKQKVKVQEENPDTVPIYIIFTDSLFISKSKEVLMNQIFDTATYVKDIDQFSGLNLPENIKYRTAPISAQETSGFVVVEEIPILINFKAAIIDVFNWLGYALTGDILTDDSIEKYYFSSNVGVYGPDGVPKFDPTISVYDFLIDFLETFNGYIEVSDSSRSAGLYFWKNIEDKKALFVDYSRQFTGFKKYNFEGGLAKINNMTYADSPDFYNGFFNNNKSIVDKTTYLDSNFGAGPLRLFGDQELQEDGTLELRTIGEISDPQTMNIFVFDAVLSQFNVFYGGVSNYRLMYRATSPNILQIWQEFHQAYTNNIALPTVGQLSFRYDAIMLSNFKMFQVFFIKQLSTYWLPLELNFTTKKDEVKIKALMLEKTPVDIPVIFDFNLSVGFYGEVSILDINLLYAAYNVSPAATMIITGADLTKNRIFINEIEVLAFPTPVSVAAGFNFRVENIEPDNVISNSDINFRFVSEQGGISRVGKINAAHNGRANFLSEFRSETDTLYTYGRDNVDDFHRFLNYSAKITTPINIADTFAPMIGDVDLRSQANISFKALQFERASTVTVELKVEFIRIKCSNRGGGAEARTRAYFQVWRTPSANIDVYSAGAIDSKKSGDTTVEYNNVSATKTFNVAAGESIAMGIYIIGTEEDRIGSGQMDGSIAVRNMIWKFYVTEQL